MDHYIVSARKYRPSTFDSVVGQKALTATLKKYAEDNKMLEKVKVDINSDDFRDDSPTATCSAAHAE